MKFINGLKYTFICIMIYFLLLFVELFIINIFIIHITKNYLFYTFLYIFLLLFINPIITYYLSEKLPFSPEGLKVEGGLEKAFKKKIKIFEDE